MWKGLCKNIGDWAKSRLGESVSDLYRAKIRQGEFKAVYSRFSVERQVFFCHNTSNNINDK